MEKNKLNIVLLAVVSLANVFLLYTGTTASLSCTIASGVSSAYAAVMREITLP